MSWRNITVDCKHYRWTVGKTNVVIQDEDGHRVSEPTLTAHELKGLDASDYQKAKYDGSSIGMITPSDIINYIRAKHLN